MTTTDYIEKIRTLQKENRALFLAHNYQILPIQKIADQVGDSLELSRLAARTDQPVILFCGVKFMAETAKVLAPDKTVLLPRLDAGCPMADMITVSDLQRLKEKYPRAAVVTYVNSSIEIKAMSDVCCTSANAVSVVRNIENKRIIFIPDRNLGRYVQSQVPEKKIVLFEAYCYVHNRIKKSDLQRIKNRYPEAEVLVHPEVKPELTRMADHVLSTGQMLKHVRKSGRQVFIVGTEEGLLDRMRMEHPDKVFLSPHLPRICSNMKRTTLEDVYRALREKRYRITIDPDTARKARTALDRMIKYT